MKINVIASSILSFALWSSTAHAAGEVTLKVAHFLPSLHVAQQKVLQPWCDTLNSESGGRIACQFYPAMQLGGTPGQLVDQVRNGVADIVWTAPGFSPGCFTAIEALELPFVIADATSGSRAAWRYYEAFAKKEFEQYKVLSMFVDGGMAFHTASKPLASMADFKNLKLRTSNRLSSQILTALGGIPVAMPPAQMTEAISKGVVDGALCTWEIVLPTKLDEVTHFHLKPDSGQPHISATVLTVLMNKQRYESLSADLKEIIDRNSGMVLSEKLGQVWDASAVVTQDKINAIGGKIATMSPDLLQKMRDAVAPVEEAWIKQASGKGMDGQKMVTTVRDLAGRR